MCRPFTGSKRQGYRVAHSMPWRACFTSQRRTCLGPSTCPLYPLWRLTIIIFGLTPAFMELVCNSIPLPIEAASRPHPPHVQLEIIIIFAATIVNFSLTLLIVFFQVSPDQMVAVPIDFFRNSSIYFSYFRAQLLPYKSHFGAMRHFSR